MDILIISLGAEAGESITGEASGCASHGDGGGSSISLPVLARAPNKFVLQNVSKFQRLLVPCLRADTPGIRQRVLRLIQRLAALYGPGRTPLEFVEAGFWDNLRASLDKRISAALSEKNVSTPASHQQGWYSSPAGGTPTAAPVASGFGVGVGPVGTGSPDSDASRNKALLSVKVLQMVAKVFSPFADSHASSLMELVRLLSRQHFLQVMYRGFLGWCSCFFFLHGRVFAVVASDAKYSFH